MTKFSGCCVGGPLHGQFFVCDKEKFTINEMVSVSPICDDISLREKVDMGDTVYVWDESIRGFLASFSLARIMDELNKQRPPAPTAATAAALRFKHVQDTSEYALAVQISLREVGAPGELVQAVAAFVAILDGMIADRTGVCDAIWKALDTIALQHRLTGSLVEPFVRRGVA